MFLFTLPFLCASALAHVPLTPSKPIYSLEESEQLFEEFIQTYNKHYADETEKKMRLKIFEKFLDEVNTRNSDPEETAISGITKFADLTNAEFKRMYTGFISTPIKKVINVSGPLLDAPDSFNWRDHGAVTRIKNQLKCGSCWAFSTIGAVEGSYAIKHKQLQELSEQQLVDCDSKNNECYGGNMIVAMEYLMTAGSESESTYPYVAKQEQCKYDKSKVVARLTDFKAFNTDEENLKQILYTNGPLSMAVDATAWKGHDNGVITKCPLMKLNHGVTLVGYGTESGVPYWEFKNSWGEDGGDHGYYKVKRGINACGMMTFPALHAVVA